MLFLLRRVPIVSYCRVMDCNMCPPFRCATVFWLLDEIVSDCTEDLRMI